MSSAIAASYSFSSSDFECSESTRVASARLTFASDAADATASRKKAASSVASSSKLETSSGMRSHSPLSSRLVLSCSMARSAIASALSVSCCTPASNSSAMDAFLAMSTSSF